MSHIMPEQLGASAEWEDMQEVGWQHWAVGGGGGVCEKERGGEREEREREREREGQGLERLMEQDDRSQDEVRAHISRRGAWESCAWICPGQGPGR